MSEDEVNYKDGIAVLLHNANDLLSTEPNTEEVHTCVYTLYSNSNSGK